MGGGKREGREKEGRDKEGRRREEGEGEEGGKECEVGRNGRQEAMVFCWVSSNKLEKRSINPLPITSSVT